MVHEQWFTSSIQALIASTNTEPLHVKRLKPMATEVFKIIKDLICIQNSSYNFRNENKAILSRFSSTVYGLRSFRYEAVRIWNSLPNELRKAESLPQFKRLIHVTLGLDPYWSVLFVLFSCAFTSLCSFRLPCYLLPLLVFGFAP